MKKILAVALAVFVALFLVGCKKPVEPEPSITEPSTTIGDVEDESLDQLTGELESDLSDEDLDTSDLDDLDSELDFSWME